MKNQEEKKANLQGYFGKNAVGLATMADEIVKAVPGFRCEQAEDHTICVWHLHGFKKQVVGYIRDVGVGYQAFTGVPCEHSEGFLYGDFNQTFTSAGEAAEELMWNAVD